LTCHTQSLSFPALTRVKFCGVCGTDASVYSGETSLVRNGLIKYFVRPGHEWSGIAEAVGSEVKDIKAGDRVIGDTVVSCGVCKACPGGDYMRCDSLGRAGTVNARGGGFSCGQNNGSSGKYIRGGQSHFEYNGGN